MRSAAAIDEALKAKEEGKQKTILFNLSGHGYLDLQAYADYHDGKLQDYEYPEEKIKEALDKAAEDLRSEIFICSLSSDGELFYLSG